MESIGLRDLVKMVDRSSSSMLQQPVVPETAEAPRQAGAYIHSCTSYPNHIIHGPATHNSYNCSSSLNDVKSHVGPQSLGAQNHLSMNNACANLNNGDGTTSGVNASGNTRTLMNTINSAVFSLRPDFFSNNPFYSTSTGAASGINSNPVIAGVLSNNMQTSEPAAGFQQMMWLDSVNAALPGQQMNGGSCGAQTGASAQQFILGPCNGAPSIVSSNILDPQKDHNNTSNNYNCSGQNNVNQSNVNNWFDTSTSHRIQSTDNNFVGSPPVTKNAAYLHFTDSNTGQHTGNAGGTTAAMLTAGTQAQSSISAQADATAATNNTIAMKGHASFEATLAQLNVLDNSNTTQTGIVTVPDGCAGGCDVNVFFSGAGSLAAAFASNTKMNNTACTAGGGGQLMTTSPSATAGCNSSSTLAAFRNPPGSAAPATINDQSSSTVQQRELRQQAKNLENTLKDLTSSAMPRKADGCSAAAAAATGGTRVVAPIAAQQHQQHVHALNEKNTEQEDPSSTQSESNTMLHQLSEALKLANAIANKCLKSAEQESQAERFVGLQKLLSASTVPENDSGADVHKKLGSTKIADSSLSRTQGILAPVLGGQVVGKNNAGLPTVGCQRMSIVGSEQIMQSSSSDHTHPSPSTLPSQPAAACAVGVNYSSNATAALEKDDIKGGCSKNNKRNKRKKTKEEVEGMRRKKTLGSELLERFRRQIRSAIHNGTLRNRNGRLKKATEFFLNKMDASPEEWLSRILKTPGAVQEFGCDPDGQLFLTDYLEKILLQSPEKSLELLGEIFATYPESTSVCADGAVGGNKRTRSLEEDLLEDEDAEKNVDGAPADDINDPMEEEPGAVARAVDVPADVELFLCPEKSSTPTNTSRKSMNNEVAVEEGDREDDIFSSVPLLDILSGTGGDLLQEAEELRSRYFLSSATKEDDRLGLKGILMKENTCASGSLMSNNSLVLHLGLLRGLEKCILGLSQDLFGQVLARKLFDLAAFETNNVGKQTTAVGNLLSEFRRRLCHRLVGSVLKLSLHDHGCRVVQKAIECATVEQQADLGHELEGNVLEVVESKNGNHVVQKLLEHLPPARLQFVLDAFRGEVRRMATHCFGSRVLQRIIEYCNTTQVEAIYEEIHDSNLGVFAHDAFANYVVQNMVEYGREKDRHAVFELVTKMFATMSCHKYASNIVEKSIQQATDDERRVFLDIVLGYHKPEEELHGEASDDARSRSTTIPGCATNDLNNYRMVVTSGQQHQTQPISTSNPPIKKMMRDNYGNYVVQKLLQFAEGTPQREEMLTLVGAQKRILESLPHGRYLLDMLESVSTSSEKNAENDGANNIVTERSVTTSPGCKGGGEMNYATVPEEDTRALSLTNVVLADVASPLIKTAGGGGAGTCSSGRTTSGDLRKGLPVSKAKAKSGASFSDKNTHILFPNSKAPWRTAGGVKKIKAETAHKINRGPSKPQVVLRKNTVEEPRASGLFSAPARADKEKQTTISLLSRNKIPTFHLPRPEIGGLLAAKANSDPCAIPKSFTGASRERSWREANLTKAHMPWDLEVDVGEGLQLWQ